MTDDEPVAHYDAEARHASGGLNLWREEIERRNRERHDAVILQITRRMYWLAVVSVLAAVVSVGVLLGDRVGNLVPAVPSQATPRPRLRSAFQR